MVLARGLWVVLARGCGIAALVYTTVLTEGIRSKWGVGFVWRNYKESLGLASLGPPMMWFVDI